MPLTRDPEADARKLSEASPPTPSKGSAGWSDFPFAPRRLPFFYGWIVLLASTAGILMSLPGQTVGVSVFNDSLLGVLSLGRVELSDAYMLGTLGSAFCLPFAGRLYDRIGARVLVVLASAGLGLVLFVLARCDRLAAELSYRSGLALPMVEFWFLALSFLGLRFFGQGVLTMTSRNMLAKWFRRRRGFVFGISGVLVAAGFSGSPRLLGWLQDVRGWRGAWDLLGALSLFGMVSFGWLLFRDAPEDCGLEMDGDARPYDGGGALGERNWTLGEALSTRAFWILNAALALHALAFTAMSFHIVDIGRTAGLERDVTLGVFLPMAAVSIVGNLVGGVLGDRLPARLLLGTHVLCLGLGSYGISMIGETAGWWLVFGGFGVAGGLFNVLSSIIWPRYFGRAHLGAISSFNLACMVAGSAVGPALFARSRLASGNYGDAAFYSLAAALVILCFVPSFRRPSTPRKRRAAR